MNETEGPRAGGPVRMWLADRLPGAAARLLARIGEAPDVRRIAVMPDVHAGEDVCNGCVLATSTLIYPQAVGADIGCGFCAVSLGRDASVLADRDVRERILSGIGREVPILRGDPAARAVLPVQLDPGRLSHESLARAAERDGTLQASTLGRGNHFVEVQSDESGGLWLLVHSGSRAMGQVITAHHRRGGRARGGGLWTLDAGSVEGGGYLTDAAWAVEYASWNRRLIAERAGQAIRSVVGMDPLGAEVIDAPHNTLTLESFGGESFLVHRKGANNAITRNRIVIAGSAGTFSVHAEGRGLDGSLRSCSHGAGRVFSRSEAARRIRERDLARQMGGVTFSAKLSGKLASEAPAAYRDLRKVLEAQRELVRITRRLVPLVSFKGV